MTAEVPQIELVLAEAVREGAAECPAAMSVDAALRAIDYHGVAGLLNERLAGLADWPEAIREGIRERALAMAMWELRHRAILTGLLSRLASRDIEPLFLKGTALAYGLYPNPSQRARGDSDILVAPEDLSTAREALLDAGFVSSPQGSGVDAQESWVSECEDGSRHVIDLHWHVLNAPTLYGLITIEEVRASRGRLDRLSDGAWAPSLPMMFAHACVHRAVNNCSPYFVDGRTYYGGDRLIWLYDLAMLGRAMTDQDWETLTGLAAAKDLSNVCLEGICAAEWRFGSFCPDSVRYDLRQGGSNRYLRTGQFGRAALDLWAVQGSAAKSRYLFSRLLPSPRFMRAKYEDMASRPLPWLYLRRLRELVRTRPGQDFG